MTKGGVGGGTSRRRTSTPQESKSAASVREVEEEARELAGQRGTTQGNPAESTSSAKTCSLGCSVACWESPEEKEMVELAREALFQSHSRAERDEPALSAYDALLCNTPVLRAVRRLGDVMEYRIQCGPPLLL
jgi:hypothetical protein